MVGLPIARALPPGASGQCRGGCSTSGSSTAGNFGRIICHPLIFQGQGQYLYQTADGEHFRGQICESLGGVLVPPSWPQSSELSVYTESLESKQSTCQDFKTLSRTGIPGTSRTSAIGNSTQPCSFHSPCYGAPSRPTSLHLRLTPNFIIITAGAPTRERQQWTFSSKIEARV